MLTFLLVIQAIVAVLLVGVILMQQSEGGGLGMGGSPTGLMSARGAADFLTRATTVLAAIFIALSIFHAVLATQHNRGGDIDTSLAKTPAPTAPAPAPGVPISGAPSQTPATSGAPALAPVPTAAPNAIPMATARPKVEQRTQRAPAPRSATTTSAAPPPVTTTVAPAASTPAAAPTNSN